MDGKRPTSITVSSINDWQADPLRWCFKWVRNRVPRRVPQALAVGKLVHLAYENAFTAGTNVGDELLKLIAPFEDAILDEHEFKVFEELAGMVEPLREWKDIFPVEEVLEVEQPFEFYLQSGAKFKGRPDRVIVTCGKAVHYQTKTLAANRDAGQFISLARRNLHELIYGWYLKQKYESRRKLEYGGTVYNILRKLKHRELLSKAKADKLVAEGKLPAHYTNVDRRRLGDIINPVSTMLIQAVVGIDLELQAEALEDVNQLSILMDRTADTFLSGGIVPSVRYRDSGYGGVDPYTSVLLGEASLDDDRLFMPREETYDEDEEATE